MLVHCTWCVRRNNLFDLLVMIEGFVLYSPEEVWSLLAFAEEKYISH
jgi:hypothetical protein